MKKWFLVCASFLFATPVNAEWVCPTCNANEQHVLQQLQEKTLIKDRNSLAAIMGNIKSESNFHSNICEGGARVSYDQCHRGGYGLVQWTTQARYDGLGYFCDKYGCDPSSVEGQTRYMINEHSFQVNLPTFEGRGWSVSQFMRPSYSWLGWGIKGHRESYAYDYVNKIVED